MLGESYLHRKSSESTPPEIIHVERDSLSDDLLEEWGLTDSQLDALALQDRVFLLFDRSSMYTRGNSPDAQESKRVQQYAIDCLAHNLVTDPSGLSVILEQSINAHSVERKLAGVNALNAVLNSIAWGYDKDDTQIQLIRDWCSNMNTHLMMAEYDPVPPELAEENALFVLGLRAAADNFLARTGWRHGVSLEQYPLEVVPGLTGQWSENQQELMVMNTPDLPGQEYFVQDAEARDSTRKVIFYRWDDHVSEADVVWGLNAEEKQLFQDMSQTVTEQGMTMHQYLDHRGLVNLDNYDDWVHADEFVAMLRDEFRFAMNTQWQIDTGKLSLEEKWYLFQYLKQHTVSDMQPVMQFARRHDLSGLRTFLSTEHDHYNGDMIVQGAEQIAVHLGEQGPGLVQQIFDKYGLIIDQSQAVDSSELASVMRSVAARHLFVLMNRAQETSAEEVTQFIDQLSAYQADNARILAEWKSGQYKQITDIPGVGIRVSDHIHPDTQQVYAMAYADNPDRAGTLYQQMHTDSHKSGFQQHQFTVGDELVSSMYQYDLPDGRGVYVGGLGSSNRLDVGELPGGTTLIDQVVNQPAQAHPERVFQATATIANSRIYMKKYNFVVVDRLDNDGDIPRFRLERCDQWTWPSKQENVKAIPASEFTDRAQSGTPDEHGRIVRSIPVSDPTPPVELSRGYVGAQVAQRDGTLYYVLEPKQVTPQS